MISCYVEYSLNPRSFYLYRPLLLLQLPQLHPFCPFTAMKYMFGWLRVTSNYNINPKSPTIFLDIEATCSSPFNHQQCYRYRQHFVAHGTSYLATDGSYKSNLKKSSLIISDKDRNIIYQGSDLPTSFPPSKSSYDAEIFAVVIGIKRIFSLQMYPKWKFTSLKIIIDNKSVENMISTILDGINMHPLCNEFEAYTQIHNLMSSIKCPVKSNGNHPTTMETASLKSLTTLMITSHPWLKERNTTSGHPNLFKRKRSDTILSTSRKASNKIYSTF